MRKALIAWSNFVGCLTDLLWSLLYIKTDSLLYQRMDSSHQVVGQHALEITKYVFIVKLSKVMHTPDVRSMSIVI